jgi:hypothetical protein
MTALKVLAMLVNTNNDFQTMKVRFLLIDPAPDLWACPAGRPSHERVVGRIVDLTGSVGARVEICACQLEWGYDSALSRLPIAVSESYMKRCICAYACSAQPCE